MDKERGRQVSCTLPANAIKRLEKLAAQQGRTRAGMVRQILIESLRRGGKAKEE